MLHTFDTPTLGRIILPTQTTPPERGSGVDQELGYEVSGAVEASRATSAEYGAARQEPRWTRGKEGLPRSAKKERRKGSSSEVDWKTLLDGSQVLELLYRLQVCCVVGAIQYHRVSTCGL